MIKQIIATSVIIGSAFILSKSISSAKNLSNKEKIIVITASYTATGNQEGLKQALIEGLDAGITVNELKEVLTQAYAYCGFPRSLNALNTLMTLTEERGNKDEKGKTSTAKPEGTSLEYGTKNQTKLVGSEVSGKLYEFAPEIDEYLKAHLFGDIFSRDIIDWKTRELATIAMLASLEGTESQLKSHINIGKHNGLTDGEIEDILKITGEIKAKEVMFGFGKENKEYEKYFTGKSYLNPLSQTDISASNVTFEPSARNNWHIHNKKGQTLFVISGTGYYQEWGKEAQKLKAGDVVNIPAGVKHWHGATKDSWFTHIAVSVPDKEATTEWLEEVSDKEYNKLK